MEKEEKKSWKPHCLVMAYPFQGHINPMLQLSKRLQHKGLKVTLVSTTHFISKSINSSSSTSTSVAFETISDGYDEGGAAQAESFQVYQDRFKVIGPQTLANLVERLSNSGSPVNCIIYDSFLPWGLDVARKFGLVGAVFFTQSCAVDSIYYRVKRGLIKCPLTVASQVLVPGLPPLEPQDMPSFIRNWGSNPAAQDLVLDQFSNIDEVDCVFCNTFCELEKEEVEWLGKICPLKPIGPTIPSMYLDKQLEDDKDYGFNIFKPNSGVCLNWLKKQAKGSVVYVSFGSLAALGAEQMEELAWGLKMSEANFLWVVRESEEEKLPKDFLEETSKKGLVVSWCPQLEVLANEAVGCFVTHCGLNSILEAISLGVPLLGMPQFTDQSTNAKYMADVWKIGIRVESKSERIASREAVEFCIRELIEGERGKEIKRNSHRWRKLAKEAMDLGGSSDKNIDEFVAKLVG